MAGAMRLFQHNEFPNIVAAAAAARSLDEAFVEKDYYVTEILRVIAVEQTFAEVRDRAERAGIEVDFEAIEGDRPAEALLAYAHEHGFDLLVCGRHHARRAGRLLSRGVGESLVAKAGIPVLVVGEAG